MILTKTQVSYFCLLKEAEYLITWNKDKRKVSHECNKTINSIEERRKPKQQKR